MGEVINLPGAPDTEEKQEEHLLDMEVHSVISGLEAMMNGGRMWQIKEIMEWLVDEFERREVKK